MSITRPLSLFCALPLLALAACGGVPNQTFTFDAIDTEEQPRPAMVVIDQDWVGAAERRQFVNVEGDDELTLTLTFDKSEIQIDIAPIPVENGAPTSLPKRPLDCVELTGFQSQFRTVRPGDARKQLFIVWRK